MPKPPPLPAQPTVTPGSKRAYRAIRRLGRWPIGNVYVGEILPSGERCTILFPDIVAGEVEAFVRELTDEVARNRLLVGLPVRGFSHASQTIDHRAFLVIADAGGPSLEEWVREKGPLQPVAALQLCVVLADALTRLHYRVRYLGELRPATVLLPRSRREGVRALDLGIARGLFERAINPPQVSRSYASPRVRGGGAPTAQDDIYALGALLHYALTGEHPPSNGKAFPSQRRKLRPFGSFLDGLVMQAMSPNPEEGALELPDMLHFASALRGLRDLHRLTPEGQQAVLMLRSEGRGLKPPPVPGAEPMPSDALGFVETDGPSFLTEAELESIETQIVRELGSQEEVPEPDEEGL